MRVEIVLNVQNIDVSFPDRSRRSFLGRMPEISVLHKVNLHIAEGKTIGLVGESGSGKSTLGKAIMKLCDVSAGSILFEEKEITGMSEEEFRPLRKEIQMIFQDPQSSLNPRQKVGKILSDPMINFGICNSREQAYEKAVNILERVGLSSNYIDRYPHQLSGGQRQRVGIARAISVEPRLVVADEIVSGLDVSVQAKILKLLKGLQKEMGLSLLFISHDLSVIRVVCDYVVVMYEGKVVEEGDCNDIFRKPSHNYTKELLEAIPLPKIEKDWL